MRARTAPATKRRRHAAIHSCAPGNIEFLADCTHALAGKTVPLPDWPYAEGEYGGV